MTLPATPTTKSIEASLRAFEKSLRAFAKAPFTRPLKNQKDPRSSQWADWINAHMEKGLAKMKALESRIAVIEEKASESEKAKGQIRESMGELLKFQKLSEAISAARNVHAVLDSLEQLSKGIVPINSSGIFLFDKQAKSLKPIRQTNMTDAIQKTIQEHFDDGIIDWVIRERRPAVVPDIQGLSAGEPPEERDGNYIIVPLIARNQGIGVYHIFTKSSKNDFTLQQLELLAMLANVAAVAVENTQLYEQMNRTIKELAILYESGKQVASVLRPQQVYQTAIQTLCGKLNVSSGWIYETSQDSKLLLKSSLGKGPFPEELAGDSPFSQVIRKEEAVLLDEIGLKRYSSLLRGSRIKALLCVPLHFQNRVNGVIALAGKTGEGPLEQSHLRLLRTLATQVSVAVENSKLYQELVQTNKDLTDMQGQLVRSGRLAAVGQLAGGVAHEVNNPLQIILGRVQMVLMEPLNPDQRKEMEVIESETKRIASIVKGLLELGRRGEKDIEFKPVDVNQILRDALLLVRHQMEVKEIEIAEDYSAEIPAIYGNGGILKQVFLNICINAEQAMKSGDRFRVRTYQEKKWVCVDFEDSGAGIPKENLDKIFEPFFTTKAEREGSGLGLSVSSDIIKKLNGSIGVRSKLGKGSCFQVRLPQPSSNAYG